MVDLWGAERPFWKHGEGFEDVWVVLCVSVCVGGELTQINL